MPNVENTAVNEIVARATGEIAADPIGMTTEVTAELTAEITTVLPRFGPGAAGRARGGAAPPAAAAFDGHAAMAFPLAIERAAPVARAASRRPPLRARLDPTEDREHGARTIQLRGRAPRAVALLPAVLLLGAGFISGAYLTLRRPRAARDASAAAAAPTVLAPARPPAAPPARPAAPPPPGAVAAAPPAIPPAPEPPGAVAAAPVAGAAPRVDVRIESTPSGATVMLVDRGRAQLVGVTPVVAALDPARAYDLLFTYQDEPARVEHVDPAATRRVAVVLGDSGSAPRRAERPAVAPPRARGERVPVGGTLMISSKPPCEIVIDGQPTGLITPQRSIALSAGAHEITLINREAAIRKAMTVRIAPNTTEKIIEDLMP